MGDVTSSLLPGSIEELHSLSIISPRHHLHSLLCPIKDTRSLTIHRHIHSMSYFRFLLHKNSLSPELKSPPLPLLTARPHMSLRRPELRSVRSPKRTFSSPNIHSELPCITTATRSNSNEFLSSHVHREPNVSHSLQYLHPVHVIFHIKINLNFKKNIRTLHQNSYHFEKLCSKSLIMNKIRFHRYFEISQYHVGLLTS
jgi:hypothetical protein